VVTSPFTAYGSTSGGVINLDSANEVAIYAFIVPYPLLVTKVTARIWTADGSNNSDIGIYDVNGTRVAHIGAQHIS
jgi:hypothetical protein